MGGGEGREVLRTGAGGAVRGLGASDNPVFRAPGLPQVVWEGWIQVSCLMDHVRCQFHAEAVVPQPTIPSSSSLSKPLLLECSTSPV